MYAFLDLFFVLFHASLILFILTGWIWPRCRRLHLLVIALTVRHGLDWDFCTGLDIAHQLTGTGASRGLVARPTFPIPM
jgi:Protein of Unknown function (DUF2784)